MADPNPDYVRTMQELRRSPAAQRHTNRQKQAKKGAGARGGRAGAKAQLKNLRCADHH